MKTKMKNQKCKLTEEQRKRFIGYTSITRMEIDKMLELSKISEKNHHSGVVNLEVILEEAKYDSINGKVQVKIITNLKEVGSI